mgnify:CR=1 FL=1
MQIKLNERGFTSIEFFLSIIALFLLLITTVPILQELIEQSHIIQIKDNLNLIRDHSDQYFEEHATNSVSLYEFIGPRKVIPELEIIADEQYTETIFRDEKISAYSKKYGKIKSH